MTTTPMPWPERPNYERMSAAESLIAESDYYFSCMKVSMRRLRVVCDTLASFKEPSCVWYGSALEFNDCDGHARLDRLTEALALCDLPPSEGDGGAG